ncbi:MAG TPA: alpha/beta-type small acid-soluble spore protein [Thermaerobacter sp.]
MALGQKTNRLLIKEAHPALDNLKYEIAAELGLPVRQGSEDYWGDVPARQAGAVGGHMVRRMIALAEQALASGQALPPDPRRQS